MLNGGGQPFFGRVFVPAPSEKGGDAYDDNRFYFYCWIHSHDLDVWDLAWQQMEIAAQPQPGMAAIQNSC